MKMQQMPEITQESRMQQMPEITQVSRIEEYDALHLLQTQVSLRPVAAVQRRMSNLTFLHIPKNAGSSIEEVALQNGIHWGEYMNLAWRNNVTFEGMPNTSFTGDSSSFEVWLYKSVFQKPPRVKMPDGNFCSPYHIPPSFREAPDVYRGTEVFCVTRNPYDRFVSEYKYLIGLVNDGATYPQLWSDALLEHPQCSPIGLNNFLQKELLKYSEGERFRLDCHLLPQTEYIFSEDHVWCADILRIEELPSSFNKLMESKGYTMRLGSEKEKDDKDVCPKLTAKDIDAYSRQLLVAAYQKDFELLGYSIE